MWSLVRFLSTLLAITSSARLTGSQHVEPLMLCSNEDVVVTPALGGTIDYVASNPASSCTLTLTGLVNGGHVSFPGVDVVNSAGNCIVDQARLSIGNSDYCVRVADKSSNLTIVEVEGTELRISTQANMNFSIEFYTNVGICAQEISIPSSAMSNQLSGIFSSSFDPSKNPVIYDCSITLDQLPSHNVTIEFTTLFPPESRLDFRITDGNKNYSLDELVSTTEREVTLDYLSTDTNVPQFVIRYTILSCGDVPTVTHGTTPTASSARLPGDTVVYGCETGYKLLDRSAVVECLLEEGETYWSNSSHIECGKVSCPIDVLPSASNVTANVSEVKYYLETIEYECENGYKTTRVCQADGTWSSPNCNMIDELMLIAIVCGAIGGLVVTALAVTAAVCIYRHCSGRKYSRAKSKHGKGTRIEGNGEESDLCNTETRGSSLHRIVGGEYSTVTYNQTNMDPPRDAGTHKERDKEEDVTFVSNELYESSGKKRAAEPGGSRTVEDNTISMIDNQLYVTTTN